MQTKPRPVFLDLANIRLPIPGIVSILHRVSGVLLFLCLPLLLCFLAATLSNESAFILYRSLISNSLIKFGLVVLLWAYLHHFFAGVRFLLLDMHKGLALYTARMTAKLVFVLAVILTILLGAWLW